MTGVALVQTKELIHRRSSADELLHNGSRCVNMNHPSCPTSSSTSSLHARQLLRLPALAWSSYHAAGMKSAAAVVAPCPQERCPAEAYFAWACPNKHGETLQPAAAGLSLADLPSCDSSTHRARERKQARRERDKQPEPKPAEVRRAKRCLLSGPGRSHACRPRVCSRQHACCQRVFS